MSIADKITSIEGHLTADYEGLENLGADLTNVNKNIQNIRTCLDNIYSSLPKTTGEGSNLSLTTLKGRINVDDILGDTKQEGTPTPSTPIDIEVVTGQQEVLVRGKNLFDGILEIGTINGNTGENQDTGSALNYVRDKNYIMIEPSTSYMLSTSNTSVITDSAFFYFYDSNKNYIEQKMTAYNSTYNGYVIGSSSNAKYMRFRPRYATTDTTIKFQLEIRPTTSSSSSAWQPYQEQTKTLHLGDIELAKIGTYQDRIFETSGKQLFDKSNSSQILNAFLNGSGKTIQSNSNARTLYIPIKPSTTYTISKILSARFILGTFESYEIGSTTTNMITATTSESAEITSRSNDNYLCVFYYLSTADTLSEETIRNSIMINEGSTALPYEPYGSDKWYIEKKIGKYTINGASGTFSKPSTNRFNIDGAFTDYLKAINTITCIADKYASYAQKGSNADFNTLVANVNFGLDLSASTSGNTIRIKDTNYDDINQYKTWLASNNVELLYVLATPTYEEITNTTLIEELNEIEKMMSYNGQTNISISGNLPMILEVTALKGE